MVLESSVIKRKTTFYNPQHNFELEAITTDLTRVSRA